MRSAPVSGRLARAAVHGFAPMTHPSDRAEDAVVPGPPSAEDALILARRHKAERRRAQGHNPFSNQLGPGPRTEIADIRKAFAAAEVGEPNQRRYDGAIVEGLKGDMLPKVAGRIMARRSFGKAVFLRVRDGSGELQLFVKQDRLKERFQLVEELDVADFIVAEGVPMVTKKGELSLEVGDLQLLTKALRPLPDKWHGLTDVDLRYRRRYLDLIANPEVAVVLRARSAIIQGLRHFLDCRGFLEVETPTLHPLVGGATARPFVTHHNALDLELFLRIAPELYLKRLLVGGFERVYEIGRCYRNEGLSTRHNPEFTILEFYQAYATYETLMDMAEELLRAVDQHLATAFAARGLDGSYARWVDARSFSMSEPFARIDMASAVTRALERAALPTDLPAQWAAIASGTDQHEAVLSEAILRWSSAGPRASRIDWKNLRKALDACHGEGERLFAAYEYLAEPFLVDDYRTQNGNKSLPVFVTDHPFEISPLARSKDSNPSLVDRFELFIEGREICNAFSELNDPDDQAERFRKQVQKKASGDAEAMDYDEDYIRALEHGMPPAAGFGLGVDRLTMMLTGSSSIRDVLAFPLLRPGAAD